MIESTAGAPAGPAQPREITRICGCKTEELLHRSVSMIESTNETPAGPVSLGR